MAFLTALAIGAGVAGSIGGAAIASAGARDAARRQQRATDQAVSEQRRQFDLTQRNQQPWLTAGTQAIQMLQFLLGLGVPPGQATQAVSQATGTPPAAIADRWQQLQELGGGGPRLLGMEDGDGRGRDVFEPSDISGTGFAPRGGTTSSGAPAGANAGDFGSLMRDFSAADFEADPGYAFRLQEGFKALERSAAARGTALSGGTLRELARYNQGFASNEFGNAYNRFQNNRATRFNQLAAISGAGQVSANTLAQTGAQNAATIGNLIVGGANAAALSRQSGANAWANAIGNASQIPLNWMMLSRLSSGGGSGGGSQPPGYNPVWDT